MGKFGENGVFRTQIRDAKAVVEAVMWDLYFTHKEPFMNPLYVPQWKADYDKIADWPPEPTTCCPVSGYQPRKRSLTYCYKPGD